MRTAVAKSTHGTMRITWVDLLVCNNKLFYRTPGIFSAFTDRGEAEARSALLRSLYAIDGAVPFFCAKACVANTVLGNWMVVYAKRGMVHG
eukprot:m.158096 g.158096  ORF g.158096 m.158096 type:complete len:91 (-) comp17979_c0_seq12:2274-2546(-)